MTKRNIIGEKFGKLTVLEYVYTKKTVRYYLCQCECGNICIKPSYRLIGNRVKSCGCLYRKSYGISQDNKLYNIWNHTKQKCLYKNNASYKYFGAIGIKLCKEWHDFKNFYDWAISNGYKSGLTLDRININKDYEPKNCKWVTIKERHNNRKDNNYVTYNGITLTLSQWAEKLGLSYFTLKQRLSYGWSIQRTLETPKKTPNK